jgi:hypothetical protein
MSTTATYPMGKTLGLILGLGIFILIEYAVAIL